MKLKIADRLTPSNKGSVHIEGYLGQRIASCIHNGVMAANHALFQIPFRDKTDEGGSWGGEFWGKWFTSAVLAYQIEPTDHHGAILADAVQGLIDTQSEDGRISSYEKDFGDWDIWGRKYALLGLIAYYDLSGKQEALQAAVLATDELIRISGPGRKKLTETGLSLLEALSSCSILEPVVLLFLRTSDQKYLDFAEYLVLLWSEPNIYNPNGIRLIEDAIAGIEPLKIASPKGYEMMSCYEGVCELYRATGKQEYLEAAIKFADLVREKETMIVGSGSSGELWCDGAKRQTELLEQPMETCVTTTWIKYCYQLLRLTGDPKWADEMEITLYNALLSAMVPSGNWWAYFSPLVGERVPSHMQVPLVQCSCCSANGPRGLLTASGWAVMNDDSGIAINLYYQGNWSGRVNNGDEVGFEMETAYPELDKIRIKVKQSESCTYTIKLRIPAWSRQTELQVNGERIVCIPGTYTEIHREWKSGDEIHLKLDLRGRVITAPGSINHKAVMVGPIVLALDSRLSDAEKHVSLWLDHEQMERKHNQDWNIDYVLLDNCSDEETYIDLVSAATKPEGVWMAFEVPFLIRPSHFVGHKESKLVMCDYASAGNEFSESNLFRVWLPQPLFMEQAFPKGTWHILVHSEDRPGIPDGTQQLKQTGFLSL
ncbi:beta-L-arabinofuranosidase domain-containing protein [Paenibacillus sp. FSL K6-3182]|uniref:beta-L-arabinofuranosidase domain-containing protein n=1 Tax=Paenibacillus sp. FSL K6-3182 TaxID=2921495 RepID=UPI0030D5D3D9